MMTSFPKLRVIHVLDTFQVGGAENFVLSLLDKHNTEEFELAVCGLHSSHSERALSEFEEKTKCYHLNSPSWSFKRNPLQAMVRMFKMAHKFKRLCNEYKPDVIHAHLFWPSILTQILFARSNVALVMTYYNTVLLGGWLKRLVRKLAVRIAKPVCIACSEVVKEVNIANGMIPSEDCVVVKIGVDTEKYNRNTVNISAKTPFDDRPDALHILQLASFTPQKGYEYTIEALGVLKQRNIPVYICAVGMGAEHEEPLKRKLEKLAQEMEVSDSIRFQGATAAEKMKLLQMADVQILPSLWEGLSLAMLEGMSMELPLIASNVGGAAEVIEDGKNGLLIQPRNAMALAEKIEILAHDRQLRRTLGQNARAKVLKEFSIQQRALVLEEVYRKAVEEKRAKNH